MHRTVRISCHRVTALVGSLGKIRHFTLVVDARCRQSKAHFTDVTTILDIVDVVRRSSANFVTRCG